jgi:GDP-D-mannose dehydratase
MVMAGSCDCYDHEAAGETGLTPETPLKATNPYAITKIMATQMTQAYRRQFGMRLSVAVLFNHTSPRRPERATRSVPARAATHCTPRSWRSASRAATRWSPPR